MQIKDIPTAVFMRYFKLKRASEQTYTNPRSGQYLTHAQPCQPVSGSHDMTVRMHEVLCRPSMGWCTCVKCSLIKFVGLTGYFASFLT